MTPSYFLVNLFYWSAWCLYSVFQEWGQTTLQRSDRKMLNLSFMLIVYQILYYLLAYLDILYLFENEF